MRRLWLIAGAFALAGCLGPAPVPSAVAPPSVAGISPDAEGLQPSGTPLRIDFGRAQAGVIETVSRILRDEPDGVFTNSECGAGPTTIARWDDGLMLLFTEGDFRGWVLDGAAYTAGNGLTPGEQVPEIPLRDTTLGQEFEQGGIFGLSEDGETIALLWVGTTCFFR